MKIRDCYTEIIDGSDQIIITLNEKFIITDLNPVAKAELKKIGLITGKNIVQFLLEKNKNVFNGKNIKLLLSGNKKKQPLVLQGTHKRLKKGKHAGHLLVLKQRFDQVELIDSGKKVININPLEKILQNVDIVFYRVKIDKSGKKELFFISKHVVDVFGMKYEEYIKAMNNGKILQSFHKEDYANILATNKQIFEKKKPSQVLYRFYNKKKKKYVWIEEKGYPVLDSKGKLVEMYGIARDINDRIESQISLQKTAGFYKSIIDDNLSGYYRIDKNSIVLEANKSFVKTFGFSSKNQVIGKKIYSLYKKSTDLDILNIVKRRKKLINHESKIILRDGSVKFFLENTAYFKDKRTKEEYIEGTIFDITEFKNTQLALKESEIKYKKLFDENLVGVFRTNVQGQIYDCNKAFINIFGYPNKASMLKVNSKDLYLSLADREKYIKDLRKSGIIKNYEIPHRKKDGTPIWILANVELIKNGKDETLQGTINDITLQKQIQDKLIQNIDKYRKLFENASDAILIIKNNKIIDCNEVSTKLLKATKAKLIGSDFASYISFPDLTKQQIASFNSIFVTGEIKNKVCGCVLKDRKGMKIMTEIAVSVITEDNEHTYQLIIHDITKQIQEQKELEQSKQNFENLIEYSPDGNIIIHQNKVLFSNSAAINMLGLKSKKEIINKNITTYFLTQQQPEINKLIAFVSEKRTNTKFYEYQLKSKLKRSIDVGIQLTNLKYGGLDCVNMIIYDLELKKQLAQQELRANIAEEANKRLEKEIYEHKNTQEKLSDQIAKTLALFEGSQNVLIYTLDKEFRITSYNSIFEKTARLIFGFDLKPNKNFIAFIEKVITPEDRATMYDRFKMAFSGDSVRLEGPMTMQNGETVWIETFLNPIKRGKEIVEISCISTDITDKKEKNEELKASLKEKDVLLKEVHHRVKNNLQIISSILNLQTSFSNDEKVNEILKESQNRVKSMAYLHESLYQNKNFTFINFSDYLINLSRNLVHSYYFSGSSVDLDMNVEKVDLNIDQAIPCGLIVNELLTNAVKYAFPQESKSNKISIKVTEEKGRVEIEVADNGIGLAKHFDVNKTNTLGLQLVSTLTEQLDGKLSVLSDKGAKFIINFKKI
jgi:PAS domain S-box-containing protein